jgi:hypothetical protein
MPVLVTSPYDAVSVITPLIRAALGDQAGIVFSDSLWGTGKNGDLQPYIRKAYARLRRELAVVTDSQQVDDDFTIYVPAGMAQVTYGSEPSLPADLLFPFQLWEKSTSGTDTFQMMRYAMTNVPDAPPAQILGYWRWGMDTLLFVPQGATEDRYVKIQYQRTFSALYNLADVSVIKDGTEIIADLAAYYAEIAREGANASTQETMTQITAEINLYKKAITRAMQGRPARRIGYGHWYHRGGIAL